MRQEITRLGIWVVGLSLISQLNLLIYSLTGDRTPAEIFAGEGNFITWLSTTQLILIAMVAYANGIAARLGPEKPAFPWLWPFLAMGLLFLAADEQLQIHEWLRDEVLAPRGLFGGMRYLQAGDVVLYFYLLLGIVPLVLLIKELGRKSLATHFFIAALGLAGVVVVMDAIPYEIRAVQWGISSNVNVPAEEMAECVVQLLIFSSFLVALREKISPGN